MTRDSGRFGKAYRLRFALIVRTGLIFLLLSILPHLASAQPCDVAWTMLVPGIDWRAIDCIGGEGVDLYVVRIDPDQWSLNTAVVNRAIARDIAESHDASFAINANFFDRDWKPIGAIVRNGDVVQPPHKSSWQSIFLVDGDGTPRIVMPSQWATYRDDAEVAVQAGPRLVIKGRMNRLHNTYAAPRGGVCIQDDGSLLFFASPHTRKFQMTEIARIAARAENDGGLACRDAMLFDGGHSVNLFAAGDHKRIDVDGDPVPVFLYATPNHDAQ